MTTFTDSRFPELSISVRHSATPHVRLDIRDNAFAQPFRASFLLDPRDARALALELTILADELEVPIENKIT